MPSLYCTECDQMIASVRSVMFEGSLMHQDCYTLIRDARRRRADLPVLPRRRAA